ncbi:Two-component sensor histidine kinase, contains HisKA and HATPase domains [Sinomicrobium oceani]|uniref:histidine kinase n=2 Tax=Sinomicrobium oceani TaxID=1150368 RepID=A0A1K1Q6A1_9FLAO|nr:Two-component sensor histidine kinase, contains HisKA and HATPase domains [Sinomicrobium oceani]
MPFLKFMRVILFILFIFAACNKEQYHTAENVAGDTSISPWNHDTTLPADSLRVSTVEKVSQMEAEANRLLQSGKRLLQENKAEKNYAEIINLLNRSLHIYTELGDKNRQADVLNYLSECYLNEDKLITADNHLQKALLLFKSTGHEHIHETYHLLQLVHNIRGNLEKSLYYSLENVKSMVQTKDTVHAGLYYHFVGENYSALGDRQKSLEWYDKALNIKNSLDTKLLYHIVNVTSKELLLLNKNQQALDLILEVAPFEKSSGIAELEEAKGYAYSALGKQVMANRHFAEMLRLYDNESRSHELIRKKSLAYLKLGSYYVDREQYNKAKGYLLHSFPFSSVSNMAKANLMLFKADSATGNYRDAISYYQTYKKLNDSIFNTEKSRQIQEIKIRYETVKKENKISDLQNENVVKSMELDRANLIKKLILGGLVLLFTASLFLYKGHVDKKRINRVLLSQKEEIAQQNNTLQELLSEKEWLIKEIHHRVKNNLQIVMSLLNTQSRYIKNPEIYAAIKKSQSRLFAISLIHQKLYKSDNSNLIDINSYIENLLRYLRESLDEGSHIKYELDVDRIMLQEDQAIPVGLILNEAITNAIKYAFPEQDKGVIKVTMKSEKDYYVLSIQDNGTGIQKDHSKDVLPSMGMTLIKGLSKQLNGSLKIENNNGTLIRVMFRHITISDIYAQHT